MGKCTIDHSLQDVRQKLADQSGFMPGDLVSQVDTALTVDTGQEFLNEVFHLLKKYDLADETEKEERNKKLNDLMK